MHKLPSSAALLNGRKTREQTSSLKPLRAQKLEQASRLELGFSQQQCAEILIGQLRGVADKASFARHSGKKRRRLAGIRRSATISATACCSPESSRNWSPRQNRQDSSNQGRQRRPSRAGPNPSVKPSPNGGPPGPGHRYGVHFLWPGPGVPPSAPAYLER